MFLYPYKIFTVSKNKRLFKPTEPHRTIGIYDATLMDFEQANDYHLSCSDIKVSILLGDISRGVKLICLDLDDCINKNGELEKDTVEFLKEFNDDEWEFSTSGEGIHIYILTKEDFPTFIVKDLEGCKSFECYTNKRHIVTTTFDFVNTDLVIGKHDKFLKDLYDRVEEIKARKNTLADDAKEIFKGTIIKNEQDLNSALYKRTPITDMYTLRGCGFKDTALISLIDENPESVDQSAHDAKLITKLMYYCLSFDAAWEMAKKTNYYKHKDERHQKKFNSEIYKERTRRFIERGFN